MVTPYRYTGQREEAGIGLYYYSARWYDPALGRFIQLDTIVPVPGNAQTLNRYAYVLNNPLRYIDPTGHGNEQSAQGGGGREDNPYHQRDLSMWMVATLNVNANLPEFHFIDTMNQLAAASSSVPAKVADKSMAYYTFIELVRDGAPTDYKYAIEKKLGTSIQLDGTWLEYSTPGNIAYGFHCAAVGFSLNEARQGAGAAQLADHYIRNKGGVGPLWTYGDTTGDYFAVELGYLLYVEGYQPDGCLTAQEFRSIVRNYRHLNRLDRRTVPRDIEPVDNYWPYPPGYFNGIGHTPFPPWLFPSFPPQKAV